MLGCPPQSTPPEGTPAEGEPFGLILAQLDLVAEQEDEFNDWYDLEHIPQRLGLPGFRTSRRAQRRRAPRYIALYDLESLQALTTPEYLGASGNHRTPWTARMLRLTRKFDRRLYQQLLPGREEIRSDLGHTTLRFVPQAGCDLAKLRAHVEEVRKHSDASARLYEGVERAAGEYFVLYQASSEPVAIALAEDTVPGGRTEHYEPYQREPEETDLFTNIPTDAAGATDAFYRRGYTDGLPIIPPTDERVDQMMATVSRKPSALVGLMAPRQGEATIEALAINAVMAGCRPAYFPIIVAAVQAMMEPGFNLLGVQATTHPVTPMIIVNGPIRYELGFNLSGNAMGEGTHANATVGRALRLILRNVGGGRPGKTDFTTQGSPARYSFCVAENEEQSPFPALHVARGFRPEQSVVTVCQAEGPHNVNDHSSQCAQSLLEMIAGTMATLGPNDLARKGHPTVALGPEHAQMLDREGWTREKVQAFLHEFARVPVERLPKEMEVWLREREDIDKTTWTPRGIPLAATPQDFLVFIAGGTGRHSSFMPSFGFGAPVSRLIEYSATGAPPPVIPDCDC